MTYGFIERQRIIRLSVLLGLGFLVILLVSLAFGSEPLSWSQLFEANSQTQKIFWWSRLPRVLLAALVGAALGSAGVAFQGLLQNPLAEPYVLGISSGAALLSLVGLLLGLNLAGLSGLAFLGAILAMILVYRLSLSGGFVDPKKLLLTGVIFNAFAHAFILIVNALAPWDQGQRVLHFLIGSVEALPYSALGIVTIFVAVGFALLWFEAHPINLLSDGLESAQSLGLDAQKHLKRCFFAASLLVGACVAVTGLIGFVGIFVPYLSRKLCGPDHRVLLPVSVFVGAILLLVCDLLARTLGFAFGMETQIPVGAMTAFLGAPYFILILRKT